MIPPGNMNSVGKSDSPTVREDEEEDEGDNSYEFNDEEESPSVMTR